MTITETLRAQWQRVLLLWRRLSSRQQIVGGTVAVLLVIAFLYIGVGRARGCSSRSDVEARVALVSSQLQEAAAQGKLSVEKLAEGIKRLNEASTAYNASSDHQAYCEVLNELRGNF